MTNTSIQNLPDLRPQLLAAFEMADRLLRATPAGSLDSPTPCDDFTVRDLRAHLLTVVQRIRIVLTGGHFSEVEHLTVVSDADYLDEWSGQLRALELALPTVDLSAPATFPFGTLPAAGGIVSYVGEVTVHSWDLATAIGRSDLLDDGLAAVVLPSTLQRIPADRDGLPFAAPVPVPADASAIDQLVGWMGRDPRWQPDRS